MSVGYDSPETVAKTWVEQIVGGTTDTGASGSRSRPNGHRDDVIRVVHGSGRVGWTAYQLQRGARSSVSGVVKPPYAATDPLNSLERAKLDEGVRFRVLYDRSALAQVPQLDITEHLVALGERARVVQAAPTKMILVDNEIALLPLTTSEHTVESAILIHQSTMLCSVQRIFEDLWRLGAPVAGGAENSGHLSEEDRWILSLLASGSTDDAIGRLMGFSARTAHRRVRDLIARLGVETRFQAGVQAARMGWL